MDGDHGHPIQTDNPQLKTSFDSYINDSVDLAKKDIADAQKTKTEIANFQKNGAKALNSRRLPRTASTAKKKIGQRLFEMLTRNKPTPKNGCRGHPNMSKKHPG